MKPKEMNLYSNFRGTKSRDTTLLRIADVNAITIRVWQQLINRLSKPVKLYSWFEKAPDFSFDMIQLNVPEKLNIIN